MDEVLSWVMWGGVKGVRLAGVLPPFLPMPPSSPVLTSPFLSSGPCCPQVGDHKLMLTGQTRPANA